MNAETIHDAINGLDDDLILQVDALRANKRRPNLWLRWLPAAACLCLVLLGTVMRNGPLYKAEEGRADYFSGSLESVMEQADATTAMMPVTIRITQLLSDGFIGTVTAENECSSWNAGAWITVSYGEIRDVPMLEVGDTVCVTVSQMTSENAVTAAEIIKKEP